MRDMLGIHPAWGITAVRIAMGAVLAVAGAKKWAFGIGATSGAFAQWGIPAPSLAGPFIGLLETVGGILLVLGLATRWLGLLFALEFVVATFWVKFRLLGWDPGRLDLMLRTGGILLFLNGPGKAAIDRG